MDLQRAAMAVSGLALYTTRRGDGLVTVSGDVVARARETLDVLGERVSVGAWSCCPCGEPHDQARTNRGLFAALDRDRLMLPAPSPSSRGPPGGRPSLPST